MTATKAAIRRARFTLCQGQIARRSAAALDFRTGLPTVVMAAALVAGVSAAEANRLYSRIMPVLPGGPPIRYVRIGGSWRAETADGSLPLPTPPL